MALTTVILTRHGETVWNTEHKAQGHLDSPLTPQGHQQGRAIAERMRGVPFDHLYSSDLERCRITAQYIADQTGHTIQFDERLRERNLGVIQGLSQAESRKQFPEVVEALRRYDRHFQVPEGESHHQFLSRAKACLDDLAQRHRGERLMVVTHGGFLMVLFKDWLGIPTDAPRKFFVRNASFNLATYADQNWMIETLGDTAHLNDLDSLDEVIQ